MSILTTCQCSRFVPAYNAYEQFQRSIIRRYPLTEAGAQRILNKECKAFPILVVGIQHAILQR